MPSKNSIKDYAENSYYHVYNRGVAKEKIFQDASDYKTFLAYLKLYLTPPDKNLKEYPSRKLKNFNNNLTLLAYCLMPNHFHLFIYQKDIKSMASFLKSVCTKYSMYFNKKYHRVGPVFQGRYKAVQVKTEAQFIYLSKYIHRNSFTSGSDPEVYPYSSYRNYLGVINQTWIDKTEVLSYFSQSNLNSSYKNFVEETDERDIFLIKEIACDLEL